MALSDHQAWAKDEKARKGGARKHKKRPPKKAPDEPNNKGEAPRGYDATLGW